MTAAPQSIQPSTAQALADEWRKEARLFRGAQAEFGRDDEEWLLNNTEAERLEKCARQLDAALALNSQHSGTGA